MHPQLIKLLALNQNRGYFKIEAKTSSEEATIYLYDVIVSDSFWGGITALDFVKALNNLTQPTIHLRINSPGGDVFAARAMSQAIKEHPGKIIAHIDGIAASAATFPVCAADEAVINPGGCMMIHNAWTIAAGGAKDFHDMATLLERTDETIVADYAAKTGKDPEQIRAWMAAETYFLGQEAIDAGFISALSEAPIKNKINWDLSAYKAPPVNLEMHFEPEPKPEPEEPEDDDDYPVDLSNYYRRVELILKTAA
jgi:ATP-dependent Clp protease, protease subunit